MLTTATGRQVKRWKIYASRCLWAENFTFFCGITGVNSAPAPAAAAITASLAADAAKTPREGEQGSRVARSQIIKKDPV